MRKYIGDRAFYKMTLGIALPMMLQNFITSLVSVLDNIMVGSLGTEQMSGVSIVNQLVFIYNLAIFGALSGVGIFTAQFYGKQDNDGIRHTLRFKLGISLVTVGVAIGVLLIFPDRLISLFLHDVDASADIGLTLAFAKDYLGVILWGLVPYALAQVFALTLRETGDTLHPMIASFSAVALNCFFNWVLIFGHFGAPAMGVKGAAAATVMSRFLECGLVAGYAFTHKKKFPYIRELFKSFSVPRKYFPQFTAKGFSLLVNELMWSAGMTTLSIAYSLNGISTVAAYSISSTICDIFTIAFMSLGASIGIIAGRQLGAKQYDEAFDSVRKLTAFSVAVSVCVGILLFTCGPLITRFYKTNEESISLAIYFIRVSSFALPLHAFANATYFTLRSGGKTLITSLFDSGSTWLFLVTMAFGLYYAGLSIYWIFPLVQAVEILKVIIGYVLVKKRVWIKTIV